jgi:hypothetical protein
MKKYDKNGMEKNHGQKLGLNCSFYGLRCLLLLAVKIEINYTMWQG